MSIANQKNSPLYENSCNVRFLPNIRTCLICPAFSVYKKILRADLEISVFFFALKKLEIFGWHFRHYSTTDNAYFYTILNLFWIEMYKLLKYLFSLKLLTCSTIVKRRSLESSWGYCHPRAEIKIEFTSTASIRCCDIVQLRSGVLTEANVTGLGEADTYPEEMTGVNFCLFNRWVFDGELFLGTH